MTAAAIILATAIVLRSFRRFRGTTVLMVGIAAIPLGVVVATCTGPAAPRTRVSVSFVGYRVPLSKITDCARRPAVWADGGTWIGGGEREENDRSPDIVALPGFRPHLLQICSQSPAFQAQKFSVRVVSPGEELVKNSNGFSFQKPADPPAQRVSMTPQGGASGRRAWERGRCFTFGNHRIRVNDVESFATRTWKGDDAAVVRPIRGRLNSLPRQWIFGPGANADVVCIDISTGAPRRCGASPDARTSLFLWRQGRLLPHWTASLPVNSVACDCNTGAIDPDSSTDLIEFPARPLVPDSLLTQKDEQALPGLSLRMIVRRFSGSVADINVTRDATLLSPSPYRLGKATTIRFARSESDLLLLVEEPTVQLRLDDLFGNAPVDALPEGDFDLSFGETDGAHVLIVNLGAKADEFLPKPIFSKWVSRISFPQNGESYLERSTGTAPRTHRLGQIATLGSDDSRVRPLVLLQRVVPPPQTLILPLVASLLLIAPLFMAIRRRTEAGREWDLAALTFALLTFRWMLATRAMLDDPESAERLFDWSFAGVFLLLTPILIIAAKPAIQHLWATLSSTIVPSTYTALLAAVFASIVWATASNSTVVSTIIVVSYAAGVIGVAGLAASVPWLTRALMRRLSRRVVAPEVVPVPVSTAQPAPVLQSASDSLAADREKAKQRWEARLKGGGATKRPVHGPGVAADGGRFVSSLNPKQAFGLVPLWHWFGASWVKLAVVSGLVLLFVRGVAMCFGMQEEVLVFPIRIDVFFIPALAAMYALLSGDSGLREMERLAAFVIFALLALLGVGLEVNDLGLLWVGGMAMVLALPFISRRPIPAAFLALLMFALGFLSPKFAREPFVDSLRLLHGTTRIGSPPNEVKFRDELQVQRDRDDYRMLDTVQQKLVENIPSELAREVVLDRERVRYQATSGAWRAGFRDGGTSGNHLFGAGYLESKPIMGQSTFREAARSDYVYPLYVRSEFGAAGLLALAAIYVTLFLHAVLYQGPRRNRRAAPLALWSLALAAGTALFMIGGTSALFPFSGKWPLFLAFASKSDFALGAALVLLGTIEEEI